MPKLECVEPADHLLSLKTPARDRQVMFKVKELLSGTGSLMVEELGRYDERRHVILNWTGTCYRNPASEEEYDLQINPANAILRAFGKDGAELDRIAGWYRV